jgi:serine/threonine protein kinase
VVTLWYRAPEILLGAQVYNTQVDLWSLGCIFGEMVGGRAMFMGDSEIGQLMSIFSVLGTPSEETWPGVSGLRDFSPIFPQWPARPLDKLLSRLPAAGVDLLRRMLTYDPLKRISAREALVHPFLHDAVPRPIDARAIPAPAPGVAAPETIAHAGTRRGREETEEDGNDSNPTTRTKRRR